MSSRFCPYCNSRIAYQDSSVTTAYFTDGYVSDSKPHSSLDTPYEVSLLCCPECGRESVEFVNREGVRMTIQPPDLLSAHLDCVPQAIAADYWEARQVLHISPKASATLSRRCLQGMIRDFWKVKNGRLIDEINALPDDLSLESMRAIDVIRRAGNVGAHMAADPNLIQDVEPEEAELLVELLGIFIEDWYVRRHVAAERNARVDSLSSKLPGRQSHKG